MTFRRTLALGLALALVPSVALAAIPWTNQQASGSVGKVEQLLLSSPGFPQWSNHHGVVKIGAQAYHWGGSLCETDITSSQLAALQAAMVAGLNVQPYYREQTGKSERCLVYITVFRT
jgi:hypothetical protein